jgi:hypothetical protein
MFVWEINTWLYLHPPTQLTSVKNQDPTLVKKHRSIETPNTWMFGCTDPFEVERLLQCGLVRASIISLRHVHGLFRLADRTIYHTLKLFGRLSVMLFTSIVVKGHRIKFGIITLHSSSCSMSVLTFISPSRQLINFSIVFLFYTRHSMRSKSA